MGRRGILGRALLRSAGGRANLSVVGMALLGAAALGSWPLLALGGAAYAALMAADLASPRFRREVMTGRLPAASTLPKADAIADAATRTTAGAVRAALVNVRKAIAATPDRLRRHIQISVDAIDELERHAALLVERAEAVAGYLASIDVVALRAEVDGLADRGRRTGDAHAREQYQKAEAASREQLRAVGEIETSRERIVASLLRIAATLNAIPAQLIRMRALDDQATDALSGTVGAELDRMNIELKAFEQTLEDLQEVEPS